MKRRSFLAMLGLAPAVAAVPAVASEGENVYPFEFKDGKLHLTNEYAYIDTRVSAALSEYDRGRLARLAVDLPELKRRGALG